MKNSYNLFLCSAIVLMVIFSSDSLQAQYRTQPKQKVEFSVSGSYLFGGIWDVGSGELNIVNDYGLSSDLSYKLTGASSIGISYSFNPTELRFRDYNNAGEESKLFDMDVHYFYLNYIMEKESRSSSPYFLVGFGAVLFDPKDNSYSNELRGATTLAGGIKIYPSKSFGFKIQARLMLPFATASTDVFAQTGGVGYATSGVSAIIQADLSAGIIIRF